MYFELKLSIFKEKCSQYWVFKNVLDLLYFVGGRARPKSSEWIFSLSSYIPCPPPCSKWVEIISEVVILIMLHLWFMRYLKRLKGLIIVGSGLIALVPFWVPDVQCFMGGDQREKSENPRNLPKRHRSYQTCPHYDQALYESRKMKKYWVKRWWKL